MKHKKDITESKAKSWGCCSLYILLLFFTSPIFVPISLAQNEPLKINGKEVKEYLMEKYKLHKDDVRSEIQQTQNGPSGKFHYMRDIGEGIALKNIASIENIHGRENRARAIAQAFLKEEAVLLGITNMGEIREYKIDTRAGSRGDYTNIYYRRHIDNLELENAYIDIVVEATGEINWVSAHLAPTPPELYEAVKKKTLSEAEIRRIVDDNLKVTVKSPEAYQRTKISNLKKYAIPSPPYVVWKAESVWVYTIDAFTGKILEKDPNWIEFLENSGKK